MVTTAPLRFMLVLVLAAWTTLCCCERRAIAEALFGGTPPQASVRNDRCAPSCCSACASADSSGDLDGDGDGDGDDDGNQEHEPGCCSDGCCVKASTAPTSFEPAVDLVGVELPGIGRNVDPRGDVLRRGSRCDLDEPHPPPWRILVVSARLRF